ncbi:FAD-dependent monooxygenase [Mycobacterium sp.]|uniref:FAD-dependent monooxygenase n=1 Tax=Mycobacterium sp. TaxID=1785 RepID=UPI002C1DA931|nr:FAD-dependent monooxygenase [Mycobacterium sp.]HKP41490.1 FAD-dependent monooxygenase [Mycobacterium sp.]
MNQPATDSDVDLDVPVLIVGGGPAGLTALLELARRGIEGLLVERRAFTTHFPRAHLLNVRTMETLHDVGVAEQVYRESPPEDRWHKCAWYTSLAGPTPLHGRKIGEVNAWGGGEDAARYAAASPRRFANLPQLRLDSILGEHAARAWPGRVRSQHELVGLDCDDRGATATIVDHDSGHSYRVRARFVIAADGGRTCAGLLGVGVSGPRALLDIVSVYFAADLSSCADPEALLTYFISPAGQGTFAAALLALGPGRWGAQSPEWSLGLAYRIGDPAADDTETILRQARQILGLPDLDMQVRAISHWQFEGVVADRFRVGPVFLVGDAAHRHPPTGGLGLNTAIGDVTNLAWKIAAVLAGEAAETLLDSYESERMPIAARNVEHSLRNAGRHAPVAGALGLAPGQSEEDGWAQIAVWAADTPEGARRRAATAVAVAHNAEDYSQLNIEAGFAYETGAVIPDGTPPPPGHDSATAFCPTARPGHHIPHIWLNRAGHPVSTSDLVAPEGMTLFVDAAHAVTWRRAAETITGVRLTVVEVDDTLADPSGEWTSVRGTRADGALLVRPDRHVAWRVANAPADPAAALAAALRRLLHPEPAPPGFRGDLAGITDAGEALRVSPPGDPRLFTVVD